MIWCLPCGPFLMTISSWLYHSPPFFSYFCGSGDGMWSFTVNRSRTQGAFIRWCYMYTTKPSLKTWHQFMIRQNFFFSHSKDIIRSLINSVIVNYKLQRKVRTHSWTHLVTKSLTKMSKKRPRAKYESWMPIRQAGIQMFFKPCSLL